MENSVFFFQKRKNGVLTGVGGTSILREDECPPQVVAIAGVVAREMPKKPVYHGRHGERCGRIFSALA